MTYTEMRVKPANTEIPKTMKSLSPSLYRVERKSYGLKYTDTRIR